MPRSLRVCLILVVALAIGLVLDVATTFVARRELEDADSLALVLGVAFLMLAAARRHLAARAAISLLAGGVTLAALEFTLIVCCAPDAGTPTWSVWPPRYACLVQPHDAPGVAAEGRFTTNTLGVRARELADVDGYRVLCVGGSTTECFYLDDERAWPSIVAAELSTSGVPSWIGNAGRSGLNTVDHITLLANWPEAVPVDCWVVLCGVNDLGQQLAGTYDIEKARTWRRTFSYRRPGLASPLERPLFRNLYTFALAEIAWDRLRHAVTWRGDSAMQDVKAMWYEKERRKRHDAPKVDALPDLAPLLNEYEANLRRIVALARQRHVRLVFLTQPTLWSPDMPSQLEDLCWAGRLPDGRYRTTAALAQAMDAYNDRLREVCRGLNVELVDLAARLPKSTDVFYDDCHFNDAGARAVGRLVAAALVKSPHWIAARDATLRP